MRAAIIAKFRRRFADAGYSSPEKFALENLAQQGSRRPPLEAIADLERVTPVERDAPPPCAPTSKTCKRLLAAVRANSAEVDRLLREEFAPTL